MGKVFSSHDTLNKSMLAGFGEAGRECCCRRFHSGVERERGEGLGAMFGKDEVISIISGLNTPEKTTLLV